MTFILYRSIIYIQLMEINSKEVLPNPEAFHAKAGFPIYLKGNQHILSRLKLTFIATLNFPKQITVSVPFAVCNQKHGMVSPFLTLQILDDEARKLIVKGKYAFKSEFFYLYYPSDVRVSEEVYKMYNKAFENMLEEVPKQFQQVVGKFILWEQGSVEHSLRSQEFKINELLSGLGKELLERKILAIRNEVRTYQLGPPTSKSLLHIYMLKNKLATIYELLSIKDSAMELLRQLWHQLMINSHSLLQVRKLEEPKDIPEPPFVKLMDQDVLGDFEQTDTSSVLRIIACAFFKLFTLHIISFQHQQALLHLQYLLEHVLKNILIPGKRESWTPQQISAYEVVRNLWTFETISIALQLHDHQKIKPLVNKEYYSTHVNLCSRLRGVVEKIGSLVYGVKNSSIVPTNLNEEIAFITEEHPHEAYQQKLKIAMQRQLQQYKKTAMLLGGQKEFGRIYLETLFLMYSSLKQSSDYKRLATSLKLSYCRAVIMLGDEEVLSKFMCEVESEWEQFRIVERLYKVHLLRKQGKSIQDDAKELITNSTFNSCSLRQRFYDFVQLHHQLLIVGEVKSAAVDLKLGHYEMEFTLSNDKLGAFLCKDSSVHVDIVVGSELSSLELADIKIGDKTLKGVIKQANSPIIFKAVRLVIVKGGISLVYKVIADKAQLLRINTQVFEPETFSIYKAIWSPVILHTRNTLNKVEQLSLEPIEGIQLSEFYEDHNNKLTIYLRSSREGTMIIKLNISISSDQHCYRLVESLTVEVNPPFDIQEKSINHIKQFALTNISHIPLQVEEWTLQPQEQLHVEGNAVRVDYLKDLPSEIILSEGGDKEIETFVLSVERLRYRKFRKIPVYSQEVGELEIKHAGEGYEMVGKVQGRVKHLKGKQIDLWIFGIKEGSILLPTLFINGKKGVWKESLIIEIQE